MSSIDVVEVRRGAYHDSVTLMQVSRDVAAVEGVAAAQVAMGTELNLDLLRGMGFDPPDARAQRPGGGRPGGRRRRRRAGGGRHGAGAGRGVGRRRPATGWAAASRRRAPWRSASRRPGGADLALVSVPGPHAFTEAMDALGAGLSVLVFSDNVPVEQEVRLKDEAAARGLLVMGPDCGTAVVGGVGLGFANAVRPGTGRAGRRQRHRRPAADVPAGRRRRRASATASGVGGRDLSAAVGGRSTRAALALLDDDPATELIVLVSKPPDPAVAARDHGVRRVAGHAGAAGAARRRARPT